MDRHRPRRDAELAMSKQNSVLVKAGWLGRMLA